MRARWVIPLLAFAGTARAGDPKPTVIDIKPLRDKLIVLQDAQGATYVVYRGPKLDDTREWYGTGKTLYEQIVATQGADASAGSWDVGTFAPRIPQSRNASVQRKDDGTYHRWCGNDHEAVLTLLTADKAKTLLDKLTFSSTALVRRPHLLSRDDSGVYYYIDVIREQYGGNGYRVWVGKKGAMKQLPLSDVASDTAGEVFATKTGDLRFVHTTGDSPGSALWVRGEKKTPLIMLDVNDNSPVIYKDLGVYPFIGTVCDDI